MTFLARGEREADTATYAQLDTQARAVAGALREAGAAAAPVLVVLPSGIDFVRAFLGCLYAGAYAVPAPYPQQRRDWTRVEGMARDAGPAVVLTNQAFAGEAAARMIGAGRVIEIAEALAATPIERLPPLPDLAFIQYTSGSTSRPKGVAVTHGNIMANQAMIEEAFDHDETLVGVNWLPLHHDMGLIGCILQPLYVGGHSIFMSPLSFLQKPARWLRAIATHRGTTAGGPNFAYDLCTRAITDAQLRDLDLSSWRLAFCGAEPVRAETMRRFAERFAPCRFDRRALYACYGLAEATLFVSGREAGSGITSCSLPRAAKDLPGSVSLSRRRLVSCGRPRRGADIAILSTDQALATEPGAIGEICVAGRNISPGFWSSEKARIVPDETRQVEFNGGMMLRTGDLGFIADGELYVAGRIKDMFAIRGANVHAEDVEDTVMSLSEAAILRTAAVFGVEREREEAMVVICEIADRQASSDDFLPLLKTIRAAVGEAHGALPAAVVLVARGMIPMTTSGKLQRGLARIRYLAGEMKPLASFGVSPAAEPAAA